MNQIIQTNSDNRERKYSRFSGVLMVLCVLLIVRTSFGQAKPEFPNDFSGIAEGAIITLAWQPVEGPGRTDGYLILINIADKNPQKVPGDGDIISDDIDFSDGYGAIHVPIIQNFHTFYSLYSNQSYLFRLFPYRGSGTQIVYNLSPEDNQIVLETGAGFITELFISEIIINQPDNQKYIEIYNGTGQNVNLDEYQLVIFDKNDGQILQSVNLTGLFTQSAVIIISDSVSYSWLGSVDLRMGEWQVADQQELRLLHNDLLIDHILISENETSENITMRRSPAVLEPNPVFSESEWQFYNQVNFSQLGIHEIDCDCVDKAFIQSRIPVSSFQLLGNFPNPFNPDTRIQFILPGTSQNLYEVKVAVYNILGQRVAILYDGFMGNGLQVIPWQGIDARGRQLPSGYYYYEVTFNQEVHRGKMILLR